MSTITRPPPPHRQGLTADGDQRIAIRGVSWDLYERLSDAIGDQHVRLNYDGKDLEIMSPGLEHEDYEIWLTLFLNTVMVACGVRVGWEARRHGGGRK